MVRNVVDCVGRSSATMMERTVLAMFVLAVPLVPIACVRAQPTRAHDTTSATVPRPIASPLVTAPSVSASPGTIEASPEPDPDPALEKTKGLVIGPGTTVLLLGDSMVNAGLGARLEKLVNERGGIFMKDSWTSSNTKTWAESERLTKLMDDIEPDVVFLVIGSNEVYLMDKQAASNVEKVVTKLEGRPCAWIGPPVWKGQNGIVEIERDHSSPCAFFDSSHLKLERQYDGIHPNTKGGATWADAVWEATVAPKTH